MFEDKLIKTVLGIEFKDDSFTVACLKSNLSGLSLISSSMFPFKDDDATINEIKKFTGRYLTGPFKVFISVPDKWSITKYTEIPLPKSEESVLQLARYEIERHIPFQIDDIFYDAVIADKKNSSCTAALIAVPKEKIEGIRKLFERLAINIDGISISHFAMLSAIELSAVKTGGWREVLGITARSGVFGGRDETGISLVIGEKEMVLSVMKNNICQDFRTIPYDAEKPIDIISEGISLIIKEILSELSLQKMHKLIISGDSPLLQNLADALKVRLGVNTQVINPLAGFLPADRAAEMQGLAPSIGACLSGLGLASMELNLLPHKTKRDSKRVSRLITKISAAAVILLGVSILAEGIVNEKRSLARLADEVKKNQSALAEVEKLAAELKTIEEKQSFLSNIKTNDIILNILLELTNLMPQDAWITNLNFKDTQDKGLKPPAKEQGLRAELTISGFADSSSKLISLLEDSAFFEKVEFVGPIKKSGAKEDFKIKAVVVHKKDAGSKK